MKLFTQTSGRHRVTAKQCCHYNCVHNESCFLVTPDAQEQATLWLMESKLEFVFIVRTRLWRRIHYLEGFLFISRLFHCFLRLQTRLWRASFAYIWRQTFLLKPDGVTTNFLNCPPPMCRDLGGTLFHMTCQPVCMEEQKTKPPWNLLLKCSCSGTKVCWMREEAGVAQLCKALSGP